MAMAVQVETRPTFYRQCRNAGGNAKIRYRTRSTAKAVMRRRERAGVKGLNVYQCPRCTFWHMGHQGRR